MNLEPYKVFKKLKDKYPVKKIVIRDDDIGGRALLLSFKNHREYITHLFKQEGIEVLRWQHDYASLTTNDPRLGVVFLANDSVIAPGFDVHVLIGHNAKYISESV